MTEESLSMNTLYLLGLSNLSSSSSKLLQRLRTAVMFYTAKQPNKCKPTADENIIEHRTRLRVLLPTHPHNDYSHT